MCIDTIFPKNCHAASCPQCAIGATGTILIISSIALVILAYTQGAWLQNGLGNVGNPHSWAMWTTFGGMFFVGGISLSIALFCCHSIPSQNISENGTSSHQVQQNMHSSPPMETPPNVDLETPNPLILDQFLNALEIMFFGKYKIIKGKEGVIVPFKIRLTLANRAEADAHLNPITDAITEVMHKVQNYLGIKCAFELELIVKERNSSTDPDEEISELWSKMISILDICKQIISVKGRYADQGDGVLCFGDTGKWLTLLNRKNQTAQERLFDIPVIPRDRANQAKHQFTEVCSQVNLLQPTVDPFEETAKQYVPCMALYSYLSPTAISL